MISESHSLTPGSPKLSPQTEGICTAELDITKPKAGGSGVPASTLPRDQIHKVGSEREWMLTDRDDEQGLWVSQPDFESQSWH